ncbi:MAG: bifunctional proline dehydrogenase/L-glutamate gamma-semialdehyde dehydrogenase, partial [Acidimicrobiales bacterium]
GRLSAAVARRNITRMAEQFIVGSQPVEVARRLGELWRRGSASTVDLLGEKTLHSGEADRYAARVGAVVEALVAAASEWPPDDVLERDDLGSLPRVSVSVKPTALAPHYAPLSAAEGRAEALGRLDPLLRRAEQEAVLVWLDMEHYEVKDLTLGLVETIAGDPSRASLEVGVVVQAYLRDSMVDLQRLVAASAARVASGGRPLWVRLVKGAYWDAEGVHAAEQGWPVPTFTDKAQTDASYDRCARLLHDNHGTVRAAFGSHNLRSLAHAVVYARSLGIPDTGYELQMLHGMAEPVHEAVRRLGLRLRVYAPMGELVPGMSYLVRRLLENTSNESFVRHRFAEGRALEELLGAPAAGDLPGPQGGAARLDSDLLSPGPYRREPPREWRRSPEREAFAGALAVVRRRLLGSGRDEGPLEVAARIGGESCLPGPLLESLNPAEPEMVVALQAACGEAELDAAVDVAARAQPSWAAAPAAARAATCMRAATWIRHHREELAAVEVLEAGKPWAEADGDVCEAIDFCEYYAREMRRLEAGGAVESPPGESNTLRYQGKGVVGVISPWNFPLAIPTGMVAAALVSGNAVVLKPAEQTPALASLLWEAFSQAGLPSGVLNLVTGVGEVVGDRLVRHPGVSMIAFTGSLAVGLQINEAAAHPAPGQRQIKRVLAELGGKNAIVVDADADLDEAVPAIVASAFGYAGQKCSAASRVVVVEELADALVDRLVGAASELVVGSPECPATFVGPLIDADAQARVAGWADRAASMGEVVLARDEVPERGYFVGPHIVDRVAPSAPLATEEIFGPVLAVLRAGSFEEALEIANGSDYALTAGVLSRSPANITLAARRLRAGNVYINRGITGAVPGRQPFGGYGLSGVGSKAGGPDYLMAFLDPRAVTENTLRQGFAPQA